MRTGDRNAGGWCRIRSLSDEAFMLPTREGLRMQDVREAIRMTER